MPNYNKNLDRFLQDAEDNRKSGLDSVKAFGQLYDYYDATTPGGLLGQAKIADKSYDVSAGDTFGSIAKSEGIGLDALKSMNQAIGGREGGFDALKIGEKINLGGGQEGTGLKGLLQMADNKFLKGAGQKALGNIASKFAGNSLVQGASSLLSAGMSAFGPALLAKQIYDFMGSTKDAYEGLEQGLENAGHMQVDLSSQGTEAKNRMMTQNQEIRKMAQDRRGNIVDAVSAKAETVMSQGEIAQARGNLESSDSTGQKVVKNKEGLVRSYMDTSNSLIKQMENLQFSNVDNYRREKTGLIQKGQELQKQIDEMDQQRKDMKLAYQVSDVFV